MSAGDEGHLESRFEKLYLSAREARSRAQETVRRAEDILQKTQVARREYQQARARAERLRELWLSTRDDRLRYSAYARMQARLASMPVIEQAKGILMAQCGWHEDEAFEVLRRVSQQSNLRVRDLAAKIVASTANGAAQPDVPAGEPAAQPADIQQVVAVMSTRSRGRPAVGSSRGQAPPPERPAAAGETTSASPLAG